MKYLWKAVTRDKKVIRDMIIYLLISSVSIWLNAKVLIWIQQALDNYKDPMKWLALVVSEMVAVTVLDAVLDFIGSLMARIFTNLIDMYVDKIADADYEMYVKYSPGKLSTIIDNCKPMSKIPVLILRSIILGIKILINICMIFGVSVKMGLAVLAIYLIGSWIMRLPIKKYLALDKAFDDLKHYRNSELDELINGFAEVRSFAGLQQKQCKTIKAHNAECCNILINRARVDALLSVMYNTIDSIGTMAILVYCIYALHTGIIHSSSQALALVMFVWRLIEPSVALINNISEFSEFYGPVPKFTEIMDYQNKISDGSIKLSKFENEISINRINFSYKDNVNVLEDVSFKIKKGQHVVVCGSSGGGKSTLLKLIPRFYDVDSGSISIDGINIKELDQQSLKAHMGIVNQDVFVFDGTIRDNIKYGACNREVSDTEVYEACKKVKLYDFIMSLPDKFDTNVGPRGLKLSGGQKQRLALARLFITNPDILILDEATSALDNETEQIIQDSLNAFADKTMIVVAHRLSTIKDSDNIIVINNHRIAEQGTHDELMALDDEYARLTKIAEKQ